MKYRLNATVPENPYATKKKKSAVNTATSDIIAEVVAEMGDDLDAALLAEEMGVSLAQVAAELLKQSAKTADLLNAVSAG